MLGAMLSEAKAFEIASAELLEDDFYTPTHRALFKAMQGLSGAGVDVDEVTLSEVIVSPAISLDEARQIVGRLVPACPAAANIGSYCALVKEKARERARVIAGGKLILGGSVEEAHKDLERATERVHTQSAGFVEVMDEMREEIEGTRVATEFPGWPALSGLGALMPEALTLLCGSPGVSKSFFALEPIWRLALERGEKVAILELEKNPKFHVRRGLAQCANRSELTDSKWIKENADEAWAIATKFKRELEAMRAVIFAPHISQRSDCRFLLRWMKEKSQDGCRVLVIDPISIMAGQEKRFLDHEEFVEGALKILQRFKNSLLCVTHPRAASGNEEIRPALQNIPGSKIWERCCDTIVWLEYHETEHARFNPTAAAMAPGQSTEAPFNRTLHTLKVRSRHNPRRLAFWFNSENLRHLERGIIPE